MARGRMMVWKKYADYRNPFANRKSYSRDYPLAGW